MTRGHPVPGPRHPDDGPDAAARFHRVVPLDAHEDTFRCTYCEHVFISEAGFALCPMGQLRNARVRVLAPAGHPLHRAAGTVVVTISAAELWKTRPVDPMMSEPLAWPDGQVLVSLDERPEDPHTGMLWTPVVTVRPGDVELEA